MKNKEVQSPSFFFNLLKFKRKEGDVAMGGKYKGCKDSQRVPAESGGNEAARAALVCKLYNG